MAFQFSVRSTQVPTLECASKEETGTAEGGSASAGLEEIAVCAVAHPVGVGAQIEQGGLGAEIAQEFAFGLGVGGGTRFGWGSVSAPQIFWAL